MSTRLDALATEIRPGTAPGDLYCAGIWRLHAATQIEAQINAHLKNLVAPTGAWQIDASAISALDTTGACLLQGLRRALSRKGHEARIIGLQAPFAILLDQVAAHLAHPIPSLRAPGLLARLGQRTWTSGQGVLGLLAFVGESAAALLRTLRQPHRLRWRPILYNLQTAGVAALPITGLLAFLLGIVIAYQGAEQLSRVGANIYIADLIGLSMVRELAPMITAIIIAGRSGSAYAAQIGTMKVTEEIDALRTIGIDPFELLVLPKLIALMIALPLLTVYTDIMGIFGGMVMASSQLDVSFSTFIERLDHAVSLTSFLIGIGKAPVFAAIIALVGCYQGFQVNGSAESVGRQTTASVVQAIFLVIVTDAMFSVAFSWLKL
ncbi:MAG: ABC transporter permease [Betaproteobacteria bacterium]|nr:MAG: ABC transporter permease [Betaproteobacteria bacterium]